MPAETTDYRALVVEDDAAIRGLIARSFVEVGIVCDAAADGQRGRELIHDRVYDAVVFDLVMPKYNGHSLAVEVLSLPKPPLTFICTGVTTKKILRDLMLRGVYDVAFKPVNYELLAYKILALLDRRKHGILGVAASSRSPDGPAVVSHHFPGATATAGSESAAAGDPAETEWSPPRATSRQAMSPSHEDSDADYRRVTVIAKVKEEELNSKLKRLSGVQPISSVALEVHNLAKSDATEVADLVSLIERDNALSVQLLRIANSAAYNRSRRRITKLEEVVVQIGRKRVGEAALAVSSMRALTTNRFPWLDQQLMWLRSMAAAMTVKLLAPDSKTGVDEEGLFLGALLHLSGRIVLATMFPKQYQAIVDASRGGAATIREKERDYFPIPHAEVMSRLLACWNVPSEIHLPLKYSALDYASLSQIAPAIRTRALYLKLAEFLARIAVGRWEAWDTVEIPPGDVLSLLDVPPIDHLLDQLQGELRDLALMLAAIQGGPVMTLPEPRRVDRCVSYCKLRTSTADLWALLAPSLGMRLDKRPCENLSAGENFLINSLGFPPGQTPNITGLAGNGGKHLLVVDEAPLDSPINFARVLAMPTGFGRLEQWCREIAAPC